MNAPRGIFTAGMLCSAAFILAPFAFMVHAVKTQGETPGCALAAFIASAGVTALLLL